MVTGRRFDWRETGPNPYRRNVGSNRAVLRRMKMPPAATLPDSALVARISEHHAYARRALPYIVPLLSKVTGFHRDRNRKLSALCDAGHEFAEALEAHLDEDEQDLFPELLAGSPRRDVFRRELDDMHRNHRALELLLARIRWLADDYDAPEWAGRSYRVLMEELEALEENVKEHLRLEKYVLIPRLWSRCEEEAA
jgi:regulator of cell morphogenesis and NO signaling